MAKYKKNADYYYGMGHGLLRGTAFGASVGTLLGATIVFGAALLYTRRGGGPLDPSREEIPEPTPKEERPLTAVPQEFVPDQIITNVS